MRWWVGYSGGYLGQWLLSKSWERFLQVWNSKHFGLLAVCLAGVGYRASEDLEMLAETQEVQEKQYIPNLGTWDLKRREDEDDGNPAKW